MALTWELTDHAATRYQQRVARVSDQRARRQLLTILRGGELTDNPPQWAVGKRHKAHLYVACKHRGQLVVVPVVWVGPSHLLALTVLPEQWVKQGSPRAKAHKRRRELRAMGRSEQWRAA